MDELDDAWWAALDRDEDGRAACALLCAAVDATRAGHRGPLPLPLLKAALRGYATEPSSDSSPALVERLLARAALAGPGVRALAPRGGGFVVDAAVVAAVTAARPGAFPRLRCRTRWSRTRATRTTACGSRTTPSGAACSGTLSSCACPRPSPTMRLPG